MTIVRAQTVGRMFGTADARGAVGAKGMQIYAPGGVWWTKKGMILRNPPYTIENPHTGQIDWRISFGEAAKRGAAKGFKEGLPATAANIRAELTGRKSAYSIPPEKYAKVSFHSLEKLKKMKAEKAKGVPISLPPAMR